MKKLTVINKGKQVRHRLGVGFLPNKETEITVSSREYLTIKAVRDFDIVKEVDLTEKKKKKKKEKDSNSNMDNNNDNDNNNQEGNQEGNENSEENNLDLQSMNMEQVIQVVEEGAISIDEAIALEIQGKNRATLLDKLEGMKEGE